MKKDKLRAVTNEEEQMSDEKPGTPGTKYAKYGGPSKKTKFVARAKPIAIKVGISLVSLGIGYAVGRAQEPFAEEPYSYTPMNNSTPSPTVPDAPTPAA